jgi:hypothetical protein
MKLTRQFYINGINQDELEMVFLSYFDRASFYENNEPHYFNQDEPDGGITIKYDKKGLIAEIIGGKNISEKVIREIMIKIRNELIENQNPTVAREVCFCVGEEFTSFFKYNDIFQILPLPHDAPKITNQTYGRQPVLLEYKYISSANHSISSWRKSSMSLKLVSVLHLLSDKRFYGPKRYTEQDWFIDFTDESKPKSVFGQLGYLYSNDNFTKNEFSDISEFTVIHFGTEHSNRLTLHEDTKSLLNLLFNLEEKESGKFFKSCYWFYVASQTWLISHSLSYTAYTTCIESLVHEREKCECGSLIQIESDETCEKCGCVKYKIGKSVDNFLTVYAKEQYSELSQKDKRLLWGIRNDISHGSKVFNKDLEPMSFLGYQNNTESNSEKLISNLVSVSLRNWLSEHAFEKGRE